jgi:diguanylate cyclase (GGDEF)-like protein/PAS domain S-box-containing protein
MNKRKSNPKQLERLSKLLEESQRIAKLGGWELDVASGELVWTDETYRIHDTTPEEFNPTVDAGVSYFLPESREIILAALDEAITNGKNYDLELQTLTTKGRQIDVRTTCQVTQRNGKTIKLTGIFQDITDRKQIEHKLAKSEERLALAIKGSQDGLWDWDLVNDTVYFSPRWKSMLGYEDSEIKNDFSEWKRLLHPEDLESALSKVEYFVNNKTDKYESEFRMQHKDGHYINILSQAFVVDGSDGKVTRFVGTHVDITERKRREESLQKAEERLAFAVNAGNLGVWDWNLLTNEVYFSQQWKSILGYEDYEIKDAFSEWERLVHPDDLENAQSQIQYFIKNNTKQYEIEFRMQHKDGHYLNILANTFAVKDATGNLIRYVGTHADITERKKAQAKINYQSTHDELTGLVNRREFERRMDQLLADAKENNQTHALCYMDLDQFKVVNDTCGHIAGDEMLKQISIVLQKVVRNSDTLARLGGDEFGILLANCSLDDALRLVNAIQTEVKDYLLIFNSHSFRVSASIGLVPITAKTVSSIELLKDADAACYMAKDSGRNRIHVQRETDEDLVKWHSETLWVNRIEKALDEDRFCLYAQSIVPLNVSEEMHYELLIRMIDEQGDIVPPGAFLPSAERYNLMTKLDQWVIENAFQALAKNPDFRRKLSFICINLSGQSLVNDHFLDFVIQKLNDYRIQGKNICFEITETAAISNLLKADKFICKLRQFGCHFALDDFGSGLSSFGYLKSLPVNFLKIDGMFVKDMVKDPIDRAMVKSINEIGHVMGMQTIAEFVENDAIKAMLLEMNVDYAQGYGIHMPQPFDQILID